MSLTLNTTGTIDVVALTDLAERRFVHPTVSGVDLTLEFLSEELAGSTSLQDAVDAGYITIEDANGDSVPNVKSTVYGDRPAFYAESSGQSTTTSLAYQQKLRLTFTPTVPGNYEISFSALIKINPLELAEPIPVVGGSVDAAIKTRVQINDTTVKMEATGKIHKGYWDIRSGNFVYDFSAEQHTIDLEYCSGASRSTAYIKESTIVARKI